MDLSATSSPVVMPAATPTEAEIPEFEIRPSRGWVAIDFRELFHYRDLLYFLVWRDVKVRYKQTVLGFAWAILQPVVNMVIFTTIFGGFAKFSDQVPEELRARHIPYSLFVYAGLLPWMLFSTGISAGGSSLANQQNLLTKVYFPRLFVPSAVIGAALVDTLISFGVFFFLMLCSGIIPPWTTVFMPLLLLFTVLATMGVAFTLAALTVTYRDFRFVLGFMVQCWMYLSPVAYPLVPKAAWKVWLLRLNPMFGIINGYRSALLGEHWDWPGLAISVIEVAAILFFGLFYFKKTERRFADIA
jgi:lipopolysaccharide transport system permease protein